MSKTPNFNQIAARLLRLTINNVHPHWNIHMREIAAQLRQVWNARGAADLEIVDLFVPRGTVEMVTDRIQALDAVDPHAPC